MPTSRARPEPESSTSWGGRTGRRAAGAVLASISFALVAPALANAAGAHVANPVAAALRGSAKAVSGALGGESAACLSPTPTAAVTSTAGESVPAEDGKKLRPCVRPSAAPSGGTASAQAVSPRAGSTGSIVSTIAACSPRGKDPLFAATGAASSHGHFVRAAAHGDTLALPFGSFDLSTLTGADGLCAALDAQRSSLPRSPTTPRRGSPDDGGTNKGGRDEGRDREDEEPKARPSGKPEQRPGKPAATPERSAKPETERSAKPETERSAKPEAQRSGRPDGKPPGDQPTEG